MAATNDQQPYGAPARVAHLRILYSFQRHNILSNKIPGSDSPSQIDFEIVLPENKSLMYLGFRMIYVNVDSPSFPYQEMLFAFLFYSQKNYSLG